MLINIRKIYFLDIHLIIIYRGPTVQASTEWYRRHWRYSM